MLVRSLYRINEFIVLPLCLLFMLVNSSSALPVELDDQSSIVEAYLHANSDDRDLALTIAKQARERALSVGDRSKVDSGPMVKLWCESAMIAPDPENLLECARYRFKAVDQMSNPQPSREAVRFQRARESLIMIRAALEIAGGDTSISNDFRIHLKSNADCLRDFISGVSTNINCNNN